MQTFLPIEDFEMSAKTLDNKRLGKQRVEVLQILQALIEGVGWKHHPATKMWQQNTNALIRYGQAICDEWTARGFIDTVKDKILKYYDPSKTAEVPVWFGRDEFHASHRSNLLRKDKEFYSKEFDDPDNLPYCWPTFTCGRWCLRFKHAGAPKYEPHVIELQS